MDTKTLLQDGDIEKEEEYFEIASARIKVSSPLMEFME